jgi:hypothetical protein
VKPSCIGGDQLAGHRECSAGGKIDSGRDWSTTESLGNELQRGVARFLGLDDDGRHARGGTAALMTTRPADDNFSSEQRDASLVDPLAARSRPNRSAFFYSMRHVVNDYYYSEILIDANFGSRK